MSLEKLTATAMSSGLVGKKTQAGSCFEVVCR